MEEEMEEDQLHPMIPVEVLSPSGSDIGAVPEDFRTPLSQFDELVPSHDLLHPRKLVYDEVEYMKMLSLSESVAKERCMKHGVSFFSRNIGGPYGRCNLRNILLAAELESRSPSLVFLQESLAATGRGTLVRVADLSPGIHTFFDKMELKMNSYLVTGFSREFDLFQEFTTAEAMLDGDKEFEFVGKYPRLKLSGLNTVIARAHIIVATHVKSDERIAFFNSHSFRGEPNFFRILIDLGKWMVRNSIAGCHSVVWIGDFNCDIINVMDTLEDEKLLKDVSLTCEFQEDPPVSEDGTRPAKYRYIDYVLTYPAFHIEASGVSHERIFPPGMDGRSIEDTIECLRKQFSQTRVENADQDIREFGTAHLSQLMNHPRLVGHLCFGPQ